MLQSDSVIIRRCFVLAVVWLFAPKSEAGFGQELLSRPSYEYAPNLTIQRQGKPPTPHGISNIQLKKSDFRILLDATTKNESWSLEFKVTFVTPIEASETKIQNTLALIYKGIEYPAARSKDLAKFIFRVPLKEASTSFELVSVNLRGAVEREWITVVIDQLPEVASENSQPRWIFGGGVSLHLGLEHWSEATSLGFTGTTNLRVPRLAGEINLRRALTTHSPAWRFHLKGHAEYSLPQTAYSTSFAYSIAWNVALRIAREHAFGSVNGWSFSPFFQAERMGSVYSSAYATTVLSETYNVLAPANLFVVWAILGLKAEHIFFNQNWEFSLSLGRTLFGGAWVDTTNLYSLGGWLVRANVNTDITQRIWVGVSGDFVALLGGATLMCTGGSIQFGLRF